MARGNDPQTVRSALILGGARSGKSAYAQVLAEASRPERLYLATGAPGDEEMAARIARHQADRGEGWTTLEEPLEVASALLAHARAGRVVVVDCLTLWLSNLMLAGRDPAPAVARLADAIGGARRSGDPGVKRSWYGYCSGPQARPRISGLAGQGEPGNRRRL